MTPETKNEHGINVTHCEHGESGYSITLHLRDIHADMGTHDYSPEPGNAVDISIFGLTADDVWSLGTLLADKAMQLKSLEIRHQNVVDPTPTEEAADARSR